MMQARYPRNNTLSSGRTYLRFCNFFFFSKPPDGYVTGKNYADGLLDSERLLRSFTVLLEILL